MSLISDLFRKMKLLFIFKIFIFIFSLNIPYSSAHKLPPHFADHNHESDPKYQRPYIRVKNNG